MGDRDGLDGTPKAIGDDHQSQRRRAHTNEPVKAMLCLRSYTFSACHPTPVGMPHTLNLVQVDQRP